MAHRDRHFVGDQYSHLRKNVDRGRILNELFTVLSESCAHGRLELEDEMYTDFCGFSRVFREMIPTRQESYPLRVVDKLLYGGFDSTEYLDDKGDSQKALEKFAREGVNCFHFMKIYNHLVGLLVDEDHQSLLDNIAMKLALIQPKLQSNTMALQFFFGPGRDVRRPARGMKLLTSELLGRACDKQEYRDQEDLIEMLYQMSNSPHDPEDEIQKFIKIQAKECLTLLGHDASVRPQRAIGA